MAEHFDVVVVGAGISGICAGYHLQNECPDRSYVILEGRDRLGGTWDLFRYPGIRSDSDMFTLGFPFRPWTGPRAIVDGPSIRSYLEDTARELGIDRHMRFHHRVTKASWSSDAARWTVETSQGSFTCNFLFMCSGYYDYAGGHTPQFPGADRFGGRIVHPQKWPEDMDYAGKRIVVIGSGATAVTLVPALAEKAGHVTMLQRSPSYVLSLPGDDPIAAGLQRRLPPDLAYRITRFKNVVIGALLYKASRRAPKRMRKLMIGGVRKHLGPDYDVDTHFSPSYDPWDERLCLVPDADLFDAIGSGRASVVTDHIESFTEGGVQLRSGEVLPADIIVTATGLTLRLFGGVDLEVDGKAVDPAERFIYKATMLSGVPNLALSVGYANASWTLRVDLTAQYVCRILNRMARGGYRRIVPRATGARATDETLFGLDSGYVRRAKGSMPKQAEKPPWRLTHDYFKDVFRIRYTAIDDPALELS